MGPFVRRTAACLAAALALIWLLADAPAVRLSTAEALHFCAVSVVPALFPFLAVTSMLIALGLGQLLSPMLEELMVPLFRVPGAGAAALLLGCIGGYPIGAGTAAELVRTGQLRPAEGRRLITFCSCANPVFLISVLGVGIFHSTRTGVWLWLIHLCAALLTGILFRGTGEGGERGCLPVSPAPERSLPAILVGAVRSALEHVLVICAFVVFFFVLAHPLRALPGPLNILLTGGLELFSAVPLLTPDVRGFVLASALTGWGGLSALCQTAAVLEGSGLPLSRAALGKAVHGLLAGLLALLLSGYVLGP